MSSSLARRRWLFWRSGFGITVLVIYIVKVKCLIWPILEKRWTFRNWNICRGVYFAFVVGFASEKLSDPRSISASWLSASSYSSTVSMSGIFVQSFPLQYLHNTVQEIPTFLHEHALVLHPLYIYTKLLRAEIQVKLELLAESARVTSLLDFFHP